MSNNRILLIEDEQKLGLTIQRHLSNGGFSVDVSPDGLDILQKVKTGGYSLMILDLNLPVKSGFEILEEIKGAGITVPVLILSARDKVADRVRGLTMGADDYLTKPFDSSELTARIHAILRRTGASGPTVLRAGDLVMDLLHQTVTRDGNPLVLSRKEYSLLEFFLRNKNQILTRKRIAEQVWGYTFDTGTNIVDVYISYLRRIIDEGAERPLIHTIVRQGYILRDGESVA